MSFNPQGTKILTAGADKTARIWNAETGEELQVLEGCYKSRLSILYWRFVIRFIGHSDEIFSCAFNYEGDTIITGKTQFK